MANQEHLDLLKRGTGVWNQWRQEHPNIQPDLSGVDFSGINLSGADLAGTNLSRSYFPIVDLSNANLRGANLRYAYLKHAGFNRADLVGADLSEADCHGTRFIGANLSGANFHGAILTGGDLRGATLIETNLYRTSLIDTNLSNANLTGCKIYGISVWNVDLEGATQSNLVLTREGEPTITVDNLKLAQFIYLLLNNEEIREVIDTITSKVVLILGRFKPERKVMLDTIRDELRKHNYSPVLFDFKKPANRDLTGTVSILAHLARFIIVDLTDPSSAPHEVATVIPHTVVPVQPVLLDGKREYSMFRDLRRRYHWVLPTYFYTDQAHLLATLQEHVIAPAEQKALELKGRMEKK